MTRHTVNRRGYAYPLLKAGCTGCGACAQVCPDFVFAVYRYQDAIELVVDDNEPVGEQGDAGR